MGWVSSEIDSEKRQRRITTGAYLSISSNGVQLSAEAMFSNAIKVDIRIFMLVGKFLRPEYESFEQEVVKKRMQALSNLLAMYGKLKRRRIPW